MNLIQIENYDFNQDKQDNKSSSQYNELEEIRKLFNHFSNQLDDDLKEKENIEESINQIKESYYSIQVHFENLITQSTQFVEEQLKTLKISSELFANYKNVVKEYNENQINNNIEQNEQKTLEIDLQRKQSVNSHRISSFRNDEINNIGQINNQQIYINEFKAMTTNLIQIDANEIKNNSLINNIDNDIDLGMGDFNKTLLFNESLQKINSVKIKKRELKDILLELHLKQVSIIDRRIIDKNKSQSIFPSFFNCIEKNSNSVHRIKNEVEMVFQNQMNEINTLSILEPINMHQQLPEQNFEQIK